MGDGSNFCGVTSGVQGSCCDFSKTEHPSPGFTRFATFALSSVPSPPPSRTHTCVLIVQEGVGDSLLCVLEYFLRAGVLSYAAGRRAGTLTGPSVLVRCGWVSGSALAWGDRGAQVELSPCLSAWGTSAALSVLGPDTC